MKSLYYKKGILNRTDSFIFLIIQSLKLAYSIQFVTGSIIILTAIVNVVGFQLFSQEALKTYISELPSTENTPDPEKLKAFLKLNTLDKKVREEYLSTISELSNLSNALENISKNPELYIRKGSGSTGSDAQILFQVSEKNIQPEIFPTLNIREFWKNTSEGRFVTSILKWLILINGIWIFFISILYFIWIRSIFRPIGIVMENIKNIIDRKKYATIRYPGKNEFSPLISTINNLQKTLSIQEKIRSDFLSDISHEIRTPITAVQCYLEAIEDGMMQLDETTLPMLQAELKRLTEITTGIMDYEKLNNENFHNIQVETFFLYKITQNIIESYRPQLEKSKQSIIIDFSKEDQINMDKNMYIQILHNLFSNFHKYSGERTTLTISLEKTRKESIILFSDNGRWIPEKEINYVKEKFYRVDKARTSRSNWSMGIGLSIIDRITRLHHWSLLIEKNKDQWLLVKIVIKK